MPTYVINPLHTNLYRKSLSLRQTKTDKVDARTIASMLMSDMNLKSYSDTSYHNKELKSLTRYRFDKVKERAKLKTSVSRLVCILFPDLKKMMTKTLRRYFNALRSDEKHIKNVENYLYGTMQNLFGVWWNQQAAREYAAKHPEEQNLGSERTWD